MSSKKKEAECVDYCALSRAEIVALARGTNAERKAVAVPVPSATEAPFRRLQPMSFWNQVAAMCFLGVGVPNGVFTVPPILFLIGYFIVGNVLNTFLIFGAILFPLAILPQAFVPSYLQSWLSVQVIKYFSFRLIFEERFEDNQHPRIFVAPPHGVFPYGNILAMLAFPSIFGFNFFGIASSSALRVPFFKQVLRGIGITDATRSVAFKVLQDNHSLGISTGGVAEVFETNADDECVLLKERKGMIKLAIRTGADLVPCYLFGNTKLLSCWAGEGLPGGRKVLERISRKVGFALILIFGRFGCPVPYRVPIMAVMGKSIPTKHMKCDEPTLEQMDEIQEVLLRDMQTLFDKYKGLYGWDDKQLIIK